MLRTNLSTRPFYNERGIHLVLLLAAVIVAALTIYNVTQIVLLTRRQSSVSQEAAAAETRAAENVIGRGIRALLPEIRAVRADREDA